ETERIHGVLRGLLDFARPERPVASDATPEPADVAQVIDDVLALVTPQKTFRAVEVKKEVRAGLPRSTLSAARLTQVLLNLLMNAGDAIAQGGENGRITVRARADEAAGAVRLEVEDDGPGISPEVKGSLFEPFVTTKDVGAGTGLGLAVCRGLVEEARGAIYV